MKDEYFEYIENNRKSDYEKELLLRKRAEYEYNRNKKNTLQAVLFSVIGGIILLTKDIFLNFLDYRFSIIFIVTGATTFLLGIGLLLYKYLQNGAFNGLTNSNYSEQNLRSELQDLRVEILKLRKKNGEPTDSQNISLAINNAIDNTLTEEFIKSKIDGFYSEKAISESRHKSILEDFENLGYRINGELIRLRRSANLNLVIGTITTSLAIIALGYEVFNVNLNFTDSVKLLSHYLPRLSLVIFVEIFAFFFLKLYKTNLQEIKYFNNEKTNIDFKIIALKTALFQDNPELIKLTLEEFIKTERNFKIEKTETTVELEKIRLDNKNNKLLSQVIGKLTDKI
ncbi:hypothetical protein JE950_001901 [Flavobacterium psychrophilum]|nr:hypothetical protein [Flavobacterium psychrophilum]